jgi:hypothetical protein
MKNGENMYKHEVYKQGSVTRGQGPTIRCRPAPLGVTRRPPVPLHRLATSVIRGITPQPIRSKYADCLINGQDFASHGLKAHLSSTPRLLHRLKVVCNWLGGATTALGSRGSGSKGRVAPLLADRRPIPSKLTSLTYKYPMLLHTINRGVWLTLQLAPFII